MGGVECWLVRDSGTIIHYPPNERVVPDGEVCFANEGQAVNRAIDILDERIRELEALRGEYYDRLVNIGRQLVSFEPAEAPDCGV